MSWQLCSFPLSNATSFFIINSTSCESRNGNLELDFGVSVRSSFSPFSIIPRTILSLVTIFYLVKWFLRFPPLKFWISLFRIGIISSWNSTIVLVLASLQISFSCCKMIVDTPVVNFSGCFNLGFGSCCGVLQLITTSSFGVKILDKYCLLMLSPSRFVVPRKVKIQRKSSWH